MERDVVEERICDTNEHNLVNKSCIEQTSAEFVSPTENEKEKETEKCRHFSIRTYVAEHRRKDWKMSWPFSSFGDNEEPKEQGDMLPPLHVPQFRWWGCQNCLQRSASDAADYRVVSNSSEVKVCDGGKANVNTSLDMIGYECRPMMYHYMTEKGAGVMSCAREDVFTCGNLKNSLVKKVNQTEPTPCERKDAQCVDGERVTKDAEMINVTLKGGRLIELDKPNCGIGDGDKVGYGVRNLNCSSNNSTEISQKGKLVSRVSKVAKMRNQQKEVIMYQPRPQVVTVEKGVEDSLIGYTCKLRSLEFNNNQDLKVVENIHDKHHTYQKADLAGTLNCRKPQKVRLLTDIIRREIWGASTMISSSNEISNSGSVNTEVTQTKETDESDSLGLDPFLGSLVAVQEDVEKDSVGKKKDRKILQVEDQEHLQMRCLKSGYGNVQISKKHEVNNCVDSGIACSKSINDVFSGVDLHSGFKRKSSENRIGGKVIQRRKKPYFEDGHSFSKLCQGNLSKEQLFLSRDLESKGTAVTLQHKMAYCSSTKRGFNHVLKCALAEQECDKKSTFCLIGSNILEDGKEPLINLQKGMQREDLILKGDAEPSQMGVAISPFSSALDTVSEIGMHPDAYSNTPTNRETFVSDMHTTMVLVKDQLSSQMYHDVNIRRTGVETLPSKAASDTIFGRGLHASLNCCMDTQKNAIKSTFLNNTGEVPLVESGIASFNLPHHKAQHKGHTIIKKVEIKPTDSESTSLASLDAFSGRVKHYGSKSTKVPLRKANMSTKRNYLCQVQGRASPIGPTDFPLIWNHGNHMDVQRHSEIIKNQCRERAKKVSELDALDGIPIEIVELLAKNRHERRLLETENANRNKCCISETTKVVKIADTVEHIGVCEDEILKNLREKSPQMQKSQSSNAEHGKSPTGRSFTVRLVGEEFINYASYVNKTRKSISSSINLLEDSCDIKGIFAGSIYQGNCSHGNQVTGAGSTWNFDFRSCKWNGDKLGHACPITCLQCLKASCKGQIVSCPMQYREAHNVCFPDVANGPFEIDCSQKVATLPHRQCRNIDSETFKKTNAESPCACTQKKIGNTGPLDLYTNESMPAMQLLGLMDAGIRARISANVNENTEYAKRPSFPFNNHFRELSPLNDEIFKIRDARAESFPAHTSKNHTIGKSWGQIPSGPISNTVSFSVQRGNSNANTCQISEKMTSQTVHSRKKMKMKSSSSPIQPMDYKLYGSASGRGNFSKNQGSFTINGLQKGLQSAPNSMGFPLPSQLIVDPNINVEVNKKVGTVWPVKGSCRTEICSVNRNPADFSLPEAGNEFMIEGGNLKARKLISKRGRPRLRMMKLMALKEPAQN